MLIKFLPSRAIDRSTLCVPLTGTFTHSPGILPETEKSQILVAELVTELVSLFRVKRHKIRIQQEETIFPTLVYDPFGDLSIQLRTRETRFALLNTSNFLWLCLDFSFHLLAFLHILIAALLGMNCISKIFLIYFWAQLCSVKPWPWLGPFYVCGSHVESTPNLVRHHVWHWNSIGTNKIIAP